MKFFVKNILSLAFRLLALVLIFQLCRLFFFAFNIEFFDETTLLDYLQITTGGIRFDLSAIFYINLLFILLSIIPSNLLFKNWYQNIQKYVYVIINTIGIAICLSDSIYYSFTRTRFSTNTYKEFSNEKNPNNLIFEFFVDFWYVLILVIAIYKFLYYIFNKTQVKSSTKINLKSFSYGFVIFLLSATFTTYGCRGTFISKNIPINISNAGKYTKRPSETPIVINTIFSILRTISAGDLNLKTTFSEEKINQIYPILKKGSPNLAFKKKNVVFIIMESMATEYYGFYNDDIDGYTPFLDSLIKESYTSELTFATGKKSIDAIPSILASIPTGKLHFALSKYCANNIDGIGTLLKKEGYNTSFFHGAANGSMGFQSISKLFGMDDYYGMNEYANDVDFDGTWGIWDSKFLPYYAQKLNKMKQPFCSGVFTLSSHHPYKLPDEYKGKFKKGKHAMHKCVQYTDLALKKFFFFFLNEKWFDNTLFVITADHTNNTFMPLYRNNMGIFRVPIVFFDPSNPKLKSFNKEIVQQIDIMPSVLSYLNYPNDYMAFGNNIFDAEQEKFAISYHNNFQIIMDSMLVMMDVDNNKVVGAYNYIQDPLLKMNRLQDSTLQIEGHKEKLMSFIQQYNNRMILNQLIVE